MRMPCSIGTQARYVYFARHLPPYSLVLWRLRFPTAARQAALLLSLSFLPLSPQTSRGLAGPYLLLPQLSGESKLLWLLLEPSSLQPLSHLHKQETVSANVECSCCHAKSRAVDRSLCLCKLKNCYECQLSACAAQRDHACHHWMLECGCSPARSACVRPSLASCLRASRSVMFAALRIFSVPYMTDAVSFRQ